MRIDGDVSVERPLRHIWIECVGAGRADEALRADWQEPFREASACSARGTSVFHGHRHDVGNGPDGRTEAVEFDHAIRHGHPRATKQGQELRGQYLLHRSCLPLDQVDLDAPAKSRSKKHLRLITPDSANSVEEDGDPDGCSPWSCRTGEPVTATDQGHRERAA